MALSADYPLWAPMEGTGLFEVIGQANASLTFYRGALAHVALGTGKLVISNADAEEFSGIVTQKVITGAADVPVPHLVRGVVWIGGCTAMALASVGKTVAATAASDSPADIVATAGGTPGAIGRLLYIDVEAASGYIDLTQRSLVVNA